jgi:Ca2+/Na+ antiporter
MTALSPGDPWMVIGAIAFTAAVVCLAAAAVYLIATARQDREEWTRPERRLSVEEAAAETNRQDSKVGLALAVIAILVVLVLAALGV